jgi:ElaB/YqjD/DUF883 family membrane-anchored ribosome-binding protein
MNEEKRTIRDELGTLAEAANALVAATSDAASEKVTDARKRLSVALDRAKVVYGRVREKAVEGAKATDQAVREHPYQAMGVAFALGAIIGCLIARGRSRDD